MSLGLIRSVDWLDVAGVGLLLALVDDDVVPEVVLGPKVRTAWVVRKGRVSVQ